MRVGHTNNLNGSEVRDCGKLIQTRKERRMRQMCSTLIHDIQISIEVFFRNPAPWSPTVRLGHSFSVSYPHTKETLVSDTFHRVAGESNARSWWTWHRWWNWYHGCHGLSRPSIRCCGTQALAQKEVKYWQTRWPLIGQTHPPLMSG